MASSIYLFKFFTLGLAAASNLCRDEHGAMSDSCLDEAASFLQMGKHATSSGSVGSGSIVSGASSKIHQSTNKTWRRYASDKIHQVTQITPVDCATLNKPLQIMRNDAGYTLKELNVSSGGYTDKASIPFSKVPGNYENLGGCGINPLDSIIYCSMFAQGSYVVRLDKNSGDVEFVARLPWFKPYNSADFAPSGTYYIGTWYAEYLAIKDLHKQKGCPASNRNCKDIMDLRTAQRRKPNAFFRSGDLVAVTADLQGNGWEEYIFLMYGEYLYIAKHNPEMDMFTESWSIKMKNSKGSRIYGAAWNFQNQLFFASNDGDGVFQINLEEFTRDTLREAQAGNAELEVSRIGASDPATSNDGMACISDPNPWLTELQSFDCKAYPEAIQAVIRGDWGGYDITSLNIDTGEAETIYSIPRSRTSPAFKTLGGFSIGPRDAVVYACLVLDDWDPSIYPTPPPFYVVRVDETAVEFVAKVQASYGSPTAGTFDADGNFFVVSNPSLIMIPEIERMKGYSSQNDAELPYYGKDSSAIILKKMERTLQIADIVALPANFDGKGEAKWVVSVNAHGQLTAVKVDGSRVEHYNIATNDVLGTARRQNFGSAWNIDGEMFVSSNDGAGVFQVPLDMVQVPDGPKVKLEKVGMAPRVHDNDGLNCISSSSVFWGRGVKFA